MKILLLALFLIPSLVFAQQSQISETGLPIKDGRVVFEQVFESKMKREDLYASIKKWVVDNFDKSKNVIQSEDKESGQFIGKGSTDVRISEKDRYNTIEFSIQVNCKDNKYRVRFYDMYIVAIRAGLIKANLRTAGEVMPLEQYAITPKGKKLTDKQLDQAKEINNYISDHFTMLLENINNNVKRSTDDDF